MQHAIYSQWNSVTYGIQQFSIIFVIANCWSYLLTIICCRVHQYVGTECWNWLPTLVFFVNILGSKHWWLTFVCRIRWSHCMLSHRLSTRLNNLSALNIKCWSLFCWIRFRYAVYTAHWWINSFLQQQSQHGYIICASIVKIDCCTLLIKKKKTH